MKDFLITSKHKQRILSYILNSKEFYMRQVVRESGCPITSVNREFKKLVKAGFIYNSGRDKNKIYYKVDQDHCYWYLLYQLLG